MYPKFKNKHLEPSFVCAKTFLTHIHKGKLPQIPENIIGVFYLSHLKEICEKYNCEDISGTDVKKFSDNIGFVYLGIGGPYSTTNMEEVIAYGAKNFINVGVIGGLQETTPICSFIIPKKAIRDEGTSYHYLKASKYITPTKSLFNKVVSVLKKEKCDFQTGTVWTTDSIYRETKKEIIMHKKDGVLGVEMEDASLYAVAEHHNISIASIHMVSDILHTENWEPHFAKEEVLQSFLKGVDLAIKVFKT